MNDEAARQGRPDTSNITAADDSATCGVRLVRVYAPRPRRPLPRVPGLLVWVPYEGTAQVVIRGARDLEYAASLRAWLASDDDLQQLVDSACRVRDRQRAA